MKAFLIVLTMDFLNLFSIRLDMSFFFPLCDYTHMYTLNLISLKINRTKKNKTKTFLVSLTNIYYYIIITY